MRHALIATVLLVTAGCGAYAFPGGGSSSPETGLVSGRVLAYPCAPVERVDSPCPGRPVKVEIDYVFGTSVAARTVTDADGNYSIRLQPESYTVRFNNYMRVISGPTKLTVAAGSSLVANYVLDSGIRAPVPAK